MLVQAKEYALPLFYFHFDPSGVSSLVTIDDFSGRAAGDQRVSKQLVSVLRVFQTGVITYYTSLGVKYHKHRLQAPPGTRLESRPRSLARGLDPRAES